MDPASPAPASAPGSAAPGPARPAPPGEPSTAAPTDSGAPGLAAPTDSDSADPTSTAQPDGEASASVPAPAAGSSAGAGPADVGPGDVGPADVGPDDVDSADEEAAPRLARGEMRSTRDMVMSLAVLIIPIALLLIFYRVVLSGDAPITVDAAPTIQEAQQSKLFPVAVPQGLSDDWHISTAKFVRQANGATLRIGFVDPDDDPIQLVESSIPAETLLPAELTKTAKPLTNFRAPSGVWRLYDARPGEKALVLADTDRTIIVVGKTNVDNLEKLATSLS